MGIEDTWQLVLLAVLIVMSAFFSASETALMSLSNIRIRSMVDENIPRSIKIQKLIQNPGNLLGAILVGNNIVNIGASALATSIAIKHFGNTGVGIATGMMTLTVLIFGEITPKSLAAQNAEKVSLRIVNILSFIVFVLKPITIVLMKITNVFIKLLGGKIRNKQPFVTEEEIKTMINMGHEEGVLEVEERKMIHNVFDFGDTRVSDVMTPRAYVIAVEKKTSYKQIVDIFRNQRFSRIPVYEENMDHIIGVLHLKDLFLNEVKEDEPFDISNYLKAPYITIEYKQTTQLFREMRDKGIQIAIVVDEYGGTAGVITIEDLVEEIVGDIRDESDELVDEIMRIDENEYVVLGIARIGKVNDVIGVNIFTENFDSIGGFVFGLFGRLPEEGTFIEYGKMKFIIEKIQRNRIERIRIVKL